MNSTVPITIPIKPFSLQVHQRKREVVWGWKRDENGQSRIVFLAGELFCNPRELIFDNWTFFYRSRYNTPPQCPKNRAVGPLFFHKKYSKSQRWETTIATTIAQSSHAKLLKKLTTRRPKKRIPIGNFPDPAGDEINISNQFPCVLYAGSGLSYEAGLLTLPELHQKFYVDDFSTGELCLGSRDPIPEMLASDWLQTIIGFLELDRHLAICNPAKAHFIIGELFKNGHITNVLTDNVDNLFEQVGIPHTFVRGNGICNELYPVDFPRTCKALLVVGVAADRRGIIRQARRNNIPIIIVNPIFRVSPRSQNLSYIRRQDTLIIKTADTFFEELKQKYLPTSKAHNEPITPINLTDWV